MESHAYFWPEKLKIINVLILPKLIYELKVTAKTLGVNMYFETRQATYKVLVGEKNQKVKQQGNS